MFIEQTSPVHQSHMRLMFPDSLPIIWLRLLCERDLLWVQCMESTLTTFLKIEQGHFMRGTWDLSSL